LQITEAKADSANCIVFVHVVNTGNADAGPFDVVMDTEKGGHLVKLSGLTKGAKGIWLYHQGDIVRWGDGKGGLTGSKAWCANMVLRAGVDLRYLTWPDEYISTSPNAIKGNTVALNPGDGPIVFGFSNQTQPAGLYDYIVHKPVISELREDNNLMTFKWVELPQIRAQDCCS
jgi:hypothetical protein